MRDVIFLMVLSVFFLVGCCTQPINAQEETESKLGLALSGEHELIQVTNGYLMFDGGQIYFTWRNNEGNDINSNIAFNQVIFKDTVVEKPIVKFRWTPTNYKYLHSAFNDNAVFYVLIYYDSKKVSNLYKTDYVLMPTEEVVEEEEDDSYDYSYDY